MPQKKDTCTALLYRRLFGNRSIAAAGHFLESLVFRLPLRADGQLFAADSAAARQDGLTVGGLHARPKPVRFGAATVVRLKSSFGHFIPGNIDYTTGWMSFGTRDDSRVRFGPGRIQSASELPALLWSHLRLISGQNSLSTFEIVSVPT